MLVCVPVALDAWHHAAETARQIGDMMDLPTKHCVPTTEKRVFGCAAALPHAITAAETHPLARRPGCSTPFLWESGVSIVGQAF